MFEGAGPISKIIVAILSIFLHLTTYNFEKLGWVGKGVSVFLSFMCTFWLLLEFGFLLKKISKIEKNELILSLVLNVLNFVCFGLEIAMIVLEAKKKEKATKVLGITRIVLGILVIIIFCFDGILGTIIVHRFLSKMENRFNVSRKIMLSKKFDLENPKTNPQIQQHKPQIQQHKNVSFVITSDKGFDGNVIVQFRPTTIELQPIEIQPPEVHYQANKLIPYTDSKNVEVESVAGVIGAKEDGGKQLPCSCFAVLCQKKKKKKEEMKKKVKDEIPEKTIDEIPEEVIDGNKESEAIPILEPGECSTKKPGGLDTRAAQTICESSGAVWCGPGYSFLDSRVDEKQLINKA